MSDQKPSLSADLLADIIADLPASEVAILSKIKEKLLGVAMEVMPAPTPKKEAKRIGSVADLQLVIDEKFEVKINFQGGDFIIEGRRLRPFESAQIQEILARPIPPVIRGDPTKPQTDRYNYDAPEYTKAKRDAGVTARAMGLYNCFPAIAAGKPDLKDAQDITKFVQSIWNDAILDTLWNTVQDGGVRSAEYVNFT